MLSEIKFSATGIRVFVINLDGSSDRLMSATKQLSEQNIEFERIPAVDGRGRDPQSFGQYLPRKAVSYFDRPMTGGEMGCYLSHLLAAKTLLETKAQYGLVLEDDMQPQTSLKKKLPGIIGAINASDPNWEIINIGKSAHKLSTDIARLDEISVQHAHYFPLTTTALVWSRKGAKSFMSTQDSIYAPVDFFFRKYFARRNSGYATLPALVAPSGDTSEIDRSGVNRREMASRRKNSPMYIFREFRRQSLIYLFAYMHLLKAQFGKVA